MYLYHVIFSYFNIILKTKNLAVAEKPRVAAHRTGNIVIALGLE